MVLPPLPTPSAQFVEQLANARAFPGGWWHATDIESAISVMSSRLEELGVEVAFPVASLEAQLSLAEVASDDDENVLRRASIRLVLGEINRALTDAGGAARFFQFAEDVPGWESDEPVWLLLTSDERDQLVAIRMLTPA